MAWDLDLLGYIKLASKNRYAAVIEAYSSYFFRIWEVTKVA